MSPASRSKTKDKKAGNEPQKASSKPSGHANAGSGVPASGYNPLLGTFHTLETVSVSSAPPLHTNDRFRNIDETDDHSGNSLGTGEYDSVSNNDSWSGESEDQKEKASHPPLRQEVAIPGADNDKREKIRQKNERKHQRQKEKRAQELHERCNGYLMSRKLEALAQQLVAMGFSSERATMALILNEGRVEESVAWLFEGGEEADKHREHNLNGASNLKIDISEELARIADMEISFKCSKQEVDRVIVTCEGDLEKAAETLRQQKEEPPTAQPQPEETGYPPTVSNGKLPVAISQNPLRPQPKPSSSATIQQKQDEKDSNYAQTAHTVGASLESGGKNVQPLRRILPKLEWEKQQQNAIPAEKRWQSAGSNPSGSYSLASPLQGTPSVNTEARYVAVGNELKNLQLGSVREPVVVMQRPQTLNTKQAPTTSISSSPPGSAAGWYLNSVDIMKPNGLPYIPSSRSLSPSNLTSNQFYNQYHYQNQQQFVSSSGSMDSPGTTQGNGLWSRMGTSPTLAAASSLGLFSGLGSNGSSGSSSPVDWSTGGSMLQLDYTNIDWTLDRGSSSSRSIGLWQGLASVTRNNSHIYDSYTSGLNARTALRPGLSNRNGVSNGGAAAAAAETSAGGSREWSSPFEERDLFSLPRQFVSSPSL
uniref:UBA domain-containing protein n=1 Tax=Davidia involucrata TaxID=16924 RepID=A0A5B6ZTN8_DAVIN